MYNDTTEINALPLTRVHLQVVVAAAAVVAVVAGVLAVAAAVAVVAGRSPRAVDPQVNGTIGYQKYLTFNQPKNHQSLEKKIQIIQEYLPTH